MEASVQHLDEVGFSHAAAELVDEGGGGRPDTAFRFRRRGFRPAEHVLHGTCRAVRSGASPSGIGHCHRYTNPVPFTPPKPIAPTPEELRGSTVLVVDDERAWRVILETDLRMLGYKGSMAGGAPQALGRGPAAQPGG